MSTIKYEYGDVQVGEQVELKNGKVLIVYDIILQHSVRSDQTAILYELAHPGAKQPLPSKFNRDFFIYNGR